MLRVQPVTNRELVRALRQELDAGEAEAISLALAIDAKKKGVIDQIRPLLDTLRDLAGFWVGEGLCKRVLDDEGELV